MAQELTPWPISFCSFGRPSQRAEAPGGDDQRARLVPFVFHLKAERALGKIGLDDGAVQVLGAEPLGLLLHVLHQLRALDALGKSGEIFDLGGERKLAARLMSRDHQRFQTGARGIDGCGVSGAAGAEDDDIMHGRFYAIRGLGNGARKR